MWRGLVCLVCLQRHLCDSLPDASLSLLGFDSPPHCVFGVTGWKAQLPSLRTTVIGGEGSLTKLLGTYTSPVRKTRLRSLPSHTPMTRSSKTTMARLVVNIHGGFPFGLLFLFRQDSNLGCLKTPFVSLPACSIFWFRHQCSLHLERLVWTMLLLGSVNWVFSWFPHDCAILPFWKWPFAYKEKCCVNIYIVYAFLVRSYHSPSSLENPIA